MSFGRGSKDRRATIVQGAAPHQRAGRCEGGTAYSADVRIAPGRVERCRYHWSQQRGRVVEIEPAEKEQLRRRNVRDCRSRASYWAGQRAGKGQ